MPVRKRCAVYTRKSTEEGLDMAFNSLDETCEAYVLRQRAEGWTLVTDHYDDGDISGATLERPASSLSTFSGPNCSRSSKLALSISLWSASRCTKMV
jgi:hypothetical protein